MSITNNGTTGIGVKVKNMFLEKSHLCKHESYFNTGVP